MSAASAATNLASQPHHRRDLTSPKIATATTTNVASTSNAATHQLAELFDDFMKFGNVGLHIVDSNGIVLWANQAELDLLGYTEEEYFGKPIANFHADQDKINEILGILLGSGTLNGYVAPIKCKDGRIEYMEINSSMRQQNGRCSTTRCFSVCVTDRILREEAHLNALAKEREAQLMREETRRKTDFLRRLCHELRNPLAGVAGNLELLMSELAAMEDMIDDCQSLSSYSPPNSNNNTACATADKENRQQDPQEEEKEEEQDPLQLMAQIKNSLRAAFDHAESAQLSADHQMLVINDTLSLSKLESEGFEFSPKPVDVNEVLTSCVAIMGSQAREKDVNIMVDLAKDAQYVKTDSVWLKQIIINLLSNSLKFSDPSGHVDIRIKNVGSPSRSRHHCPPPACLPCQPAYVESKEEEKNGVTLQISVEDTGIGMTQEEQSRLFGAFAQANDMIASKFGGSGLGLHIVKELLDHVGGTITTKSQKGVGTTFTLTLPCGALTPEEQEFHFPKLHAIDDEQVDDQEQQAQQGSMSIRKKASRKSSISRSPTSSTATTGDSTTNDNKNSISPGKIRVLVVDDVHVNRKMIVSFLNRRGYVSEQAENGQVALQLHLQDPYDIILTDVDMPIMDGHELVRRIRSYEKAAAARSHKKQPSMTSTATTSATSTDKNEASSSSSSSSLLPREVPVIGISGNVFAEDREAANKVGINEYVNKPFKFPQLEALIIKHLC